MLDPKKTEEATKARDNKLADIVAAIEAWKNDCEERGEEPVCTASFAFTDPDGSGKTANSILVGTREEVDELLAQAVATSNETSHRLYSKIRFAYEG